MKPWPGFAPKARLSVLNPVPGPVREIVKYGTVLGVAMLPIVLGLWRWKKRQQWRGSISTAFAVTPAA